MAASQELTVADWLAEQPDREDARQAFLSAIEGLWCQAPATIPLWYLVDNDRRITNEVPELQYFLKGTMQALALELAKPLGDGLRTQRRRDADRAWRWRGQGSRGRRGSCRGKRDRRRAAGDGRADPVPARASRSRQECAGRLEKRHGDQGLAALRQGVLARRGP